MANDDNSVDTGDLLKLIETLKNEVSGRVIGLDDNKNLVFNFNEYDVFLGDDAGAYRFKLSKGNRAALSIIAVGKFGDYQKPLSDLYSHCVALADKYPLENANRIAGDILEVWDE